MVKDPNKSKHKPQGVTIVHDDPAFLVVDKVAGLLTIGTEKDKTNTLYYRMTDWVRKGNPKSRNRVFIVHRLDRETSGLLLLARTWEAKAVLQGTWDENEKKYLAVVHGTLRQTEGTFESYLTENTAFVVHATQDRSKGKLSRTDYRVLQETAGYSLLELRLITGRKHQIRVHLADAGHPIVGDEKYGKEKDGGKRLALHAYSIAFNHPVTGERMRFETKVPAYFTTLVNAKPAAARRPAGDGGKAGVRPGGKPAAKPDGKLPAKADAKPVAHKGATAAAKTAPAKKPAARPQGGAKRAR